MAKTSTSIAIRHFRDDDLPRVLELLRSSLGGGPGGMRTGDFFRWKHLENPFGRSFALIGEADGRLVGFRAFMRWRLSAAGTAVLAVRAVDTATHPDYQGQGIFSTLTRRSIESLRDEADLVFNTPNEKSLPGYLKMGWQIAGKVPVRVRVRRPFRFVRRIRSLHEEIDVPLETPPIAAATAAEVLAGEDSLPELLLRTSPRIADSPPRETSRICDGATEPRRSSTTAPSRSRRTAASTGWRSSGSGLVAVCGSPRSPRCSLPRETVGPPRSSSPASVTPARSTTSRASSRPMHLRRGRRDGAGTSACPSG